MTFGKVDVLGESSTSPTFTESEFPLSFEDASIINSLIFSTTKSEVTSAFAPNATPLLFALVAEKSAGNSLEVVDATLVFHVPFWSSVITCLSYFVKT
ncbi:hypothetical protein [Paraprevotella clara]|uniref:hypothetical protein n=1 Tax=Paraprevotella clara TaxID=454154 RepID=UPI002674ECE9|nr:hypothetical protein [Paraprevotella clara]